MLHLTASLLLCLTIASLDEVQAGPKGGVIMVDAPAASPVHEQANLFAKAVADHPLARELMLRPELVSSGASTDLVAQLQAGEIDIAMLDSELERIDDRFGFFDLPMLFDNAEQVQLAIEKGPLIAEITKRAGQKANLEVLGAYGSAFTHLVTAGRHISRAQDLEGLRIQIKPSEKRKEMFRVLGAEPTEMRSPGETLAALRSGEVDAIELDVFDLYDLRDQVHGLTLNLTKHAYVPALITVSPQFWRKLTPKEREAFIIAGQDVSDQAFQVARSREQEYLRELSEIMTMHDVERESIRQKTQPAYDAFKDKHRERWFLLLELGTGRQS